MKTEDYIRDCAARGFSKTMVMEALGVNRPSFYAMLELLPPIEWPAPGQSLACKLSYESRRGTSTPALRASAEKGRKARLEKYTYTVDGVQGTLTDLAKRWGVEPNTVRRRMSTGKTLKEALEAVPHHRGKRKVRSA
ncbi:MULTISPECIES: hypothetical protein [Pseudomonas]|uniref:hypothetical protein n=1 Tax=Pseudomonas TaxID=286 RepID=UPI0012E2D576|nr:MULTISPECIES: hypothetical protein [Pseudomonas]MDG9809499.1 hypothetical protein [Pseudomonas juntendi]MDG9815745.1 hypothetical protein [Pseudomonas putida]